MFSDFGVVAGTRSFLENFNASGCHAIDSLILHLCTISESSNSSVAPESGTFPLSLGILVSVSADKSLVILALVRSLRKGDLTLQKIHVVVPLHDALLENITNFCSFSLLD